MKRTNIMLADDQHAILKGRARTEGKTLGELVRAAVTMAYEKKDSLEQRKTVALQAYREGLISLELLGARSILLHGPSFSIEKGEGQITDVNI